METLRLFFSDIEYLCSQYASRMTGARFLPLRWGKLRHEGQAPSAAGLVREFSAARTGRGADFFTPDLRAHNVQS